MYSHKTWNKAEEACTEKGGHLASVHDVETTNFILSLSRSGTNFWLGGHQPTSKSPWAWSDSSTFNYVNWNTGEPNNSGGREDCLHLTSHGKWNDGPCDYTGYDGYVCQM